MTQQQTAQQSAEKQIAKYQVNTVFAGLEKEMPDRIQSVGYINNADDPFIPTATESYEFRRELVRDLVAFLNYPLGDALYITGPTGSGKTSLVTECAARLSWPVQQITMGARTEAADLIGHYVLMSDSPGEEPQMRFQYGPLATAMREGQILLLNEVDLADPGELAALNDVLEGRPLVIASNGGEIIKPHRMFRVVVTGNSTGNGDSTGLYQGVMMQNLAAMDRYRFMIVDYPTKEAEVKLLQKILPASAGVLIPMFVDVANKIRESFVGQKDDGNLSVTMSTRTLLRWAKLTALYKGAPNAADHALQQALLIRAAPEEAIAIQRIAKDVFGQAWGK